MKAIGIKETGITGPGSLVELELEKPVPAGHDLLVRVKAASVNPVDFKVRDNVAKGSALSEPRILGWDASGVVEAVGEQVTLFKPGDEVFYAGDLNRAGSNATYQLVDERITGTKPARLTHEEAAAVPLTGLTAWEMLFDRIRISPEKDRGKTILVIGGAGGVGSIAIQLARQVAGLIVIATASRPETIAWCKAMGAQHVVNHKDLVNEVRNAGFRHVDYILDLVDTEQYWGAMAELIKPQGHIASITGSSNPLPLNLLKGKSASFSWELMFTRSMFQTDDLAEQHHILDRLAGLLDQGVIKTTCNERYTGLSEANLRKAHEQSASGKTIGKITIAYDEPAAS